MRVQGRKVREGESCEEERAREEKAGTGESRGWRDLVVERAGGGESRGGKKGVERAGGGENNVMTIITMTTQINTYFISSLSC